MLTDYQSIISMKKVQERFTSKSYPATWLLGYQTVSEAIRRIKIMEVKNKLNLATRLPGYLATIFSVIYTNCN